MFERSVLIRNIFCRTENSRGQVRHGNVTGLNRHFLLPPMPWPWPWIVCFWGHVMGVCIHRRYTVAAHCSPLPSTFFHIWQLPSVWIIVWRSSVHWCWNTETAVFFQPFVTRALPSTKPLHLGSFTNPDFFSCCIFMFFQNEWTNPALLGTIGVRFPLWV